MVKKFSAQLYLPNEYRIPVPHNHTNMVKFLSPSDGTYRTVVTRIKECLDHIVEARSMSSIHVEHACNKIDIEIIRICRERC